MQLLQTYQNELLALLLVTLLLYIAFRFVQIAKKKKSSNLQEEIWHYDQKIKEKELTETTDTTKKSDKTSDETVFVTYHKKESLPHGKITKESFALFKGARILLAEDNKINQKVIQGILAESGIELVIANDGVEVLQILQKNNNFDLILMDAHMPNMDGFEATQKIRAQKRYSHIPVVALSGDTSADDVKKMLKAGMCEHLEKPLRIEALYDVFASYIDGEIKTQTEQGRDTETLNTAQGLEIAGDDRDFYKEILQNFMQNYATSDQKLHNFIQNNQIQKADNLLLDIVGISANIGATALCSTAKELKATLTQNQYRDEQFKKYEKELQNLLQAIKSYLKEE